VISFPFSNSLLLLLTLNVCRNPSLKRKDKSKNNTVSELLNWTKNKTTISLKLLNFNKLSKGELGLFKIRRNTNSR
jgi:hypothetical protein